MKKIYTLLLAVIIAGGASAQSLQMHTFKKQSVPVAISNSVKPAVSNVLSQSKDINATLNQNFDVISFPPASWSVSGVASAWFNSGNASINQYEANGTPNGHFAYFDCFNLADLAVASLVTPVLHPTAASNTFSYKVNCYLLNTTYLAGGPKIFIEFSTNGGTTWTTSTTNVLATLPNYNVTSSGWVTQTASLAAYNGATVMVRLRGVSDYGGMGVGIDDVTGPEADIVTAVNDIQVLSTYADFSGMSYYELTPLTQAGDVNLCGAVVNNGSAAQTNVTLHATDATNAITGTTIIPSQPAAQIDTMIYVATLDNVNAKDYGFKMWATQTQTDEVPANNAGDSIYFSTDPSMYARSTNLTSLLTSYSFGTGAPAITGMEYGCNYHFLNADKIDTLFVLIYGANGTGTVTGKLYNQDLTTGARTVVAQTAAYTPSGLPEIAALPFTSFYTIPTVPAVLTAAVQLNLNVTTAPRDTIKIGADNTFAGDAGVGGAAYLKVSGAWGWYYVTGTVPIVGLVIDRATGINSNLLSKDLFVYPNPVSNTLYVMNKKAISVDIYNLSGQVVASYNNENVIDVTKLAQGSYLVKVVTADKTITEKINIVR